MLFVWLRLVPPAGAFAPRAKWISLGLGVLFAGNVFLLFKSFETVEVPIAILTYFVYPLLTGLAAAASGLETISWRGAAAALAALLGLALMRGAPPTTLATAGILAALGAARCRAEMLLATRARLLGADALRSLSSTGVFILATLATANWQPPASASGWLALVVLSLRGHHGAARRLRLDRAHRPVPHRAVHEPRAAAHRHRQRAFSRRGAHPAAGARRRRDAGCTRDVSAAQVKSRAKRPRHTRSTKLSTTRFSPALSNWMVSLLPSIAVTLPLPNFW